MDYNFEEFFDYSPDLLCIAGTDGYFKRINPSFERVLGWSSEELLEHPFFDFIHPDDVQPTQEEIDRLASGMPTISFGNRYRCKDGSYRHLSWSAHPDPKTGLLYAIARDETELRVAEERFRLALESSPAAMIMVDERGEIVMVNHATETLFGYDATELLGRSIETLLPARYREGHVAVRDGFIREPDARPMGDGLDLTALRKDGTEFPVEIGINPIRFTESTFVLASIMDLSERRKAKEELERSNAELQNFAYVASHDLQEPLRMVAGYTELLARRYGDELDDEARQFIQFAVEGSERMQELIQGLLAYSRVQLRGGDFEPLDVNEAVEWARANLETAIVESGATVRCEDLPVLKGDPTQLGQLFQNLIANAIKFRDDRPPRVDIEAARENGHWKFAVRDNGIGIEEEYQERIFEIFQRLHSREQYEGSGIGLAVCRRIVERHGGRIWLESETGEGTTFLFTIPAAGAGSNEVETDRRTNT